MKIVVQRFINNWLSHNALQIIVGFKHFARSGVVQQIKFGSRNQFNPDQIHNVVIVDLQQLFFVLITRLGRHCRVLLSVVVVNLKFGL